MSEEGKIINWRLTKSTSKKYKKCERGKQRGVSKVRLGKQNKNLEPICVDDRCKVRNKY